MSDRIPFDRLALHNHKCVKALIAKMQLDEAARVQAAAQRELTESIAAIERDFGAKIGEWDDETGAIVRAEKPQDA